MRTRHDIKAIDLVNCKGTTKISYINDDHTKTTIYHTVNARKEVQDPVGTTFDAFNSYRIQNATDSNEVNSGVSTVCKIIDNLLITLFKVLSQYFTLTGTICSSCAYY